MASQSQAAQSSGFGPSLPAAVETVRFVFASDTGSRCCVAVDPYRACTDPSCERRAVVIDDLAIGPGTIQVSAFAATFAPTAAGVGQTCSIEPAGAGRPCDASRLATPSFDSAPQPVTISAGTETNAGDIAIPAVPFVLDGTLHPVPNSVAGSPVPVGFTVADAVTGIDPQSIAVSLTQGAARGVPLTLTPCNDASEATCSDGGRLQVSGFRVASDPQPLDGGHADVSIVARNRAPQPRILTLTYGVSVPAPPTAIPPTGTRSPSRTSTPTPTTTVEATLTATPVTAPISFIRAQPQVVSPQPAFFAVADFNRDGRDDVAVSSPRSEEVNVLLGSADGSFNPGTVLTFDAFDAQPGWIAAGDLDGDDYADLVVADGRGGAVFTMLNRKDGTFAAPSKRPVGGSPFAVAIADFDGQKGNDLAISNQATNRVSILFNEGGQTLGFGARRDYEVGTGPEDLLVAKFNNDANLDIVTLNNGGGAKNVTLLVFDGMVSGLPNFRRSDFGVGQRPSQLTLGDFNNDGLKDLALLNRPLDENRSEVQFLLGATSGAAFQPGETLRLPCPFSPGEGGCRARALAVGDFDLDGNDDLAVTQSDPAAGAAADGLRIFAGTGDGTSFVLGSVFPTNQSPNAIAVGDVTGDELPDLVVASDNPSAVQGYVNVSTP